MTEPRREALSEAPLLRDAGAADLERGQAFWLTAKDGVRLRAAVFAPERPQGSVVLSPGRTEHIEKYLEVAGELVGRGYCVLIHDWRGQGLSDRLLADRLRGHAAGFTAFLDDYDRLLAVFADRLPRPRLGLGHSMGGCLTLLALDRDASRFDGAILSAPMLGLKTGDRPEWLVRAVAWLMARSGHAGDYVMGDKAYDPEAVTFEGDRLTHDPVRYARTRAQMTAWPELMLGDVTWGWLDSAFDGMARARNSRALARQAIPVTIVAAGRDRLVRNEASRAMAARLPRGRYVEIEGAFHEILMETDAMRAVFWDEFDALAGAIRPRPRAG